MGFALFLHAWFDGVPGALFSLGGLVTGLGLFLFFYLSGGIGAGDVKLMAAVGAMVGPLWRGHVLSSSDFGRWRIRLRRNDLRVGNYNYGSEIGFYCQDNLSTGG
jgi:prepilin signal peptidase PulO-like enzyme (type II secretory pathway)